MTTPDYGWAFIEQSTANAMQLASRAWSLSMSWGLNTLQDIAGDQHIGVSIGIISRVITLQQTFFKITADVEAFLNTATVLNAAGTSTVKIKVNTAPTFFAFKSGVTSLEMFFETIAGLRKVELANGTVYMIDVIKLRQAG